LLHRRETFCAVWRLWKYFFSLRCHSSRRFVDFKLWIRRFTLIHVISLHQVQKRIRQRKKSRKL